MIVMPPTIDEATGHVAEMYADDIADVGFVLPHTRAMALNPEAELAFRALAKSVVPAIGLRLYELVTLAAAGAMRSQHCLLMHGRKTLVADLMDQDQLARLARDHHDAGLSDAEVAAMDYAAKLSADAAAMTDADSRMLRDHGYTDRQIVDITITAAVRNYLSRFLLALAVPVEDVPGIPAELRDALLAGSTD